MSARLGSIRWVWAKAEQNQWALGNYLKIVFADADNCREVAALVKPAPSRREKAERQRAALYRLDRFARTDDERLAALAESERTWEQSEMARRPAA